MKGLLGNVAEFITILISLNSISFSVYKITEMKRRIWRDRRKEYTYSNWDMIVSLIFWETVVTCILLMGNAIFAIYFGKYSKDIWISLRDLLAFMPGTLAIYLIGVVIIIKKKCKEKQFSNRKNLFVAVLIFGHIYSALIFISFFDNMLIGGFQLFAAVLLLVAQSISNISKHKVREANYIVHTIDNEIFITEEIPFTHSGYTMVEKKNGNGWYSIPEQRVRLIERKEKIINCTSKSDDMFV